MKEQLMSLDRESIIRHLVEIPVKESGFVEQVASKLGEEVFCQEEACLAIGRAVARFESGLVTPNRPLEVAFFLGPTGVGKTEMGHSLAKYLFDDRDSPQLKIINCSEYESSHTVMRFTGAPPSYVGYGDEPVITPQFLNSRNIIVFDEIEKAHRALHRMLLGIMDKGKLNAKVGEGNHAQNVALDFSNSFIIMTSNVGAEAMANLQAGRGQIGFIKGRTDCTVDEAGKKALKKHFADMPEFLNRVDDIVVFKPLTRESGAYHRIYWKFMGQLNETVKGHSQVPFFVTTTHEFEEHCIDVMDCSLGGRDLQRVLDRELTKPLSNLVMSLDVYGCGIVVDWNNGVKFYSDHLPPKYKKPGTSLQVFAESPSETVQNV